MKRKKARRASRQRGVTGVRKSRRLDSHSNASGQRLSRAVTFLRDGLPRDALHVCEQILIGHPRDADALNLSGIACFQLGFAHQGIARLRTAVERRPDFAEAHNNLGNVLRAVGRLAEAQSSYRRAIAINQAYVDAHFNLGLTLELGGKQSGALAAYERTLALDPDYAEAHLNIGNIFKALGRYDDALRAYERVLHARPADADALNNTGSVLHEVGRLEDAREVLARAVESAPRHVDALYNLGLVCHELGELSAAIDAYRRGIAIDPDHARAHVNLGYALHGLGRLEAAVDAYERAIDLEPDNTQAHTNLADVHLQRGVPHQAVAVCDACLAAHPGDTGALAFKAIALNEADEHRAVSDLLDFERFIRTVRCAVPAGYAGLDSFNAALAAHVRGHPTLVRSPSSHATRDGEHSGELLDEPGGPVTDLARLIREQVDAYKRMLSATDTHPFAAHMPREYGLSIWGVVLHGTGHQIAHIHPAAWLSGVYYARVPAGVSCHDGQHGGWIEFGKPPEHFHTRRAVPVCRVQPEAGLMLLFPSYFYHRTLVGKPLETRISIAFDVVAAEAC